jgi:carbonic anhydrase/acetyltransferase-like protein (isoleucine patch superfamily)
MKAILICPSSRRAVTYLEWAGPLATAPIMGESTVGYWIEHLASRGASSIRVICTEPAEHVSEAVGDGAQWGVRAVVTVVASEPTAKEASRLYRPAGDPGWMPPPFDVVTMTHLPGNPEMPLFDTYAGWFEALVAWMPRAITPGRVRMAERSAGIWVGSRAQVSLTARLVAPCWIGDQASIEAGAEVGPGAIIEDRALVGEKAIVSRSWVGPDTSVGPMTSVVDSLAWASTLVNWRTDSALHVPDPFLLSALSESAPEEGVDRFGRALSRTPAKKRIDLVPAMGRASQIKQPG